MRFHYSQGYIALTTVIILSFVMTAIVVAMSKEVSSFHTFVNYRDGMVRGRAALLSCVSVVREKIAEEHTDAPIIVSVVLPDGYRCDIEIMHTQPFVTARVRVGGRGALLRIDPTHTTVMSLSYDLL